MIKQQPKICPVRNPPICLEDECAWWLKFDDAHSLCAVTAIGLNTYLKMPDNLVLDPVEVQ